MDEAELLRLSAQVTDLQTRMSEMVYERQRANRFGGRARRQQVVFGWVERVFGASIANNVIERATRVLEEAVEVAQAAGIARETAIRVVNRCFGRDVGNVEDEVANLSITLLALCATLKVDAETLERDEIERILAIPDSHMRDRQARKFDAGIGMMPTS